MEIRPIQMVHWPTDPAKVSSNWVTSIQTHMKHYIVPIWNYVKSFLKYSQEQNNALTWQNIWKEQLLTMLTSDSFPTHPPDQFNLEFVESTIHCDSKVVNVDVLRQIHELYSNASRVFYSNVQVDPVLIGFFATKVIDLIFLLLWKSIDTTKPASTLKPTLFQRTETWKTLRGYSERYISWKMQQPWCALCDYPEHHNFMYTDETIPLVIIGLLNTWEQAVFAIVKSKIHQVPNQFHDLLTSNSVQYKSIEEEKQWLIWYAESEKMQNTSSKMDDETWSFLLNNANEPKDKYLKVRQLERDLQLSLLKHPPKDSFFFQCFLHSMETSYPNDSLRPWFVYKFKAELFEAAYKKMFKSPNKSPTLQWNVSLLSISHTKVWRAAARWSETVKNVRAKFCPSVPLPPIVVPSSCSFSIGETFLIFSSNWNVPSLHNITLPKYVSMNSKVNKEYESLFRSLPKRINVDILKFILSAINEYTEHVNTVSR
jgi:hypothetical protein